MSEYIKNNFAVVYTVKNEERLLPLAIKYHMAAGASSIFVYLDGTTDKTKELISNIDGVFVFETNKPSESYTVPKWMAEILPLWDENMDVRKRINTYYAAGKAHEMGLEWLVCIDPDELVLPYKNAKINKSLIRDFLGSVSGDVDQILMRNLELVPSVSESENPFLDGVNFLSRFPITEEVCRYTSAVVRRVVRNPVLHAWYEHLFYKLRFLGLWPRLMRHPVTNQKIPISYFMGYSNHKSIIRTSSAAHFNFDIHKWRKFSSSPRTVYSGHVLHYDVFDYKYMALKFRQRSPSLILKVFYCRYMFGLIARECDMSLVKKFFENNVVLNDKNKIDRLVKKGIVVTIEGVSDFFRELKLTK